MLNVSRTNEDDTQLINKLFIDSHADFLKNGWKLKENTLNYIVYINPVYPTDEFKININNRTIKVTVPVLDSNYEYSTNFNSYYLANEFLLLHLKKYKQN